MIKVERVSGFDAIQRACGTTQGKDRTSIKPSTAYAQEHSVLRFGTWLIQTDELSRSGCLQMVRHNKRDGYYSVMQSSRPDWTGRSTIMDRTEKLWYMAIASDMAILKISRERLCGRAELSTSAWWAMVCSEICIQEPDLGLRLVPDCIVRGYCKEGKKCCGFIHTPEAKKQRDRLFMVQE